MFGGLSPLRGPLAAGAADEENSKTILSDARGRDVQSALPRMLPTWHYMGMEVCITIARDGTELPGPAGTQSYGPLGSPSAIFILNGFARNFAIRNDHGAFSLKWIPKGAARYEVDRAQHHLVGDKVLLLHTGQSYEVEFLDRSGTESFCLFFSGPLLKEALADGEAYAELQPVGRLGRLRDQYQFADMVFQAPIELAATLHGLRRSIGTLDEPSERFEETVLSLLGDLAAISHNHRQLAHEVAPEF